jgi:hypothetical protein
MGMMTGRNVNLAGVSQATGERCGTIACREQLYRHGKIVQTGTRLQMAGLEATGFQDFNGIAAYCRPGNKVALGFVEGVNNKIRVIQRRACGLRDTEYLRLKVLTSMLLNPGGHPNSSTCGHLKFPHP